MGVEEISTTFDISPIFFVETGRIKAGTTDCVLLQQFFTDIATNYTPKLHQMLERGSYHAGPQAIDPNAVELKHREINEIEGQIHKELEKHTLHEVSRDNGLEIIPCATILNRISKPLVSPGVFFYLCRRERSEEVQQKLSSIREIELEAFNELNESYPNSPEEADSEWVEKIVSINRMEGELLGYPQCCVSEFIKSREKGRNHETEIALQCLQNGDVELALDCFLTPRKVRGVELPNSFYSHFTSNFYPCSVECDQAISISKRNEHCFGDLYIAYEGRLILNVLYHLATSYGSYRIIKAHNLKLENDYRKQVWKFFDRFDEENLQFMEKIKDLLIYSPNEIGDAYIKKVIEHEPS